MRGPIIFALTLSVLTAWLTAAPALAGGRGQYEVFGVDEDDMLKLRAGPGLGYVVIVGLPNGAVVRIESCQLIGGTQWCKVALERARSLKGYVSATYLRQK